MTDRIEPALPAQTWFNEQETARLDGWTLQQSLASRYEYERPAEKIALANAALPDSDPRKITWAMVQMIRTLAEEHQDDGDYDEMVAHIAAGNAIADALASYLPPE